jgi:non-specific serine/threonine protein kinase
MDQLKTLTAHFTASGFALQIEPAEDGRAYRNDAFIAMCETDRAKALLDFGFCEKNAAMPPPLAYIHSIAERFVQSLAENPDIEFTLTPDPPTENDMLEMLRGVPYAVGVEHVTGDWLVRMWEVLTGGFYAEFKAYTKGFAESAQGAVQRDSQPTVAAFLASRKPAIHQYGRVFFHLVENKKDDEGKPFAFLATYSTNAASGSGATQKAAHMPLKNALIEYKGDNEALLKLLSTVNKAASQSALVAELVESGELFSPLKFTAAEAHVFLRETPLYEECGILCRIPDWWKKQSQSVRISISVGDKAPSEVGMDALLSFSPELFFGGEKISKRELEQLLAETGGLSNIKGKWVAVDQEKLRAALDAYDRAVKLCKSQGFTLAEAMRMQLQPDALGILNAGGGQGGDELVSVEVTNGEWLSALQNRIKSYGADGNEEAPGGGFKASLRHYQLDGFRWLVTMENLKFGALLADDMGLGKTVQILAFLERMRRSRNYRALLIIPASLIGNWEREIQKFAPKLSYKVLHGAAAAAFSGLPEASADVDETTDSNGASDDADASGADDTETVLTITTYGMAIRLTALLRRTWDAVILDEAQAIKNASTKQTRAVKRIPSAFRIAMTGTPIENRLADLWSIFDFLNAGLLGSPSEFTSFTKTLNEAENYSKLRDVVNPFILRRLKTDKRIIGDLPEKIEIKDFAPLTRKQALLYANLVNELEATIEKADGIQRKGLVLASILKFKQICNHPDQYLDQGAFDASASGKYEKLAEICETIREKRERVLVFTQFREIVGPLSSYLERLFGFPGLTLHGGTPVKQRAELVDRFSGDAYVPFMVLSIKAGGVGLNLTNANHVVHFDRWWNPAVENQATDRAFRIGQTKNVMVHKLVTLGTIEDKIDEMIEKKQRLAGDIISGSGEKWITELGDEELMGLVRLN